MNLDYIGNELDLFSHAKNWKEYWFSKIQPYLGNSILEVGAGIGTNAVKILSQIRKIDSLTCIEPDFNLANQIIPNILSAGLKSENVLVSSKFLSDCEPSIKYDSILYIDVIEHIEDDRSEIELAIQFLKPRGTLIIVVPAHNFLFSPFDKSIGHFRRYNKKMLNGILPKNLEVVKLNYLDSMGMIASLANKMLLKQNYPTINQILLWDKKIVPLSKHIDRLTNYRIGKSLLFIGRKS